MCLMRAEEEKVQSVCVCVCAKGGAGLTCNILKSVIPSQARGFTWNLIKSMIYCLFFCS